MTQGPPAGGDDNALPTYGLRAKVRRVGWATLTKHKWVNFGERRRSGTWPEEGTHSAEGVRGALKCENGGGNKSGLA